MNRAALLAAVCVTLAGPARADVPGVLTFQGYLEQDGAPRDGTVHAMFDLYDAETGGSRLFTQTDPQLQVTAGAFAIDLQTPAGTPTLRELFQGQRLWLEVTLNSETLTPRTPLGSVPYAIRAGAVAWADIEGIPADLADGDQDTTYQPGTGLGLNGTTFNVDDAAVQDWARQACFDTAAELQSVLDPRYLQLAGGTVGGPVTFQGEVTVPTPAVPAHAATRAYVDGRACTFGPAGGWSACAVAQMPSCGYSDGLSYQQATITCGTASLSVIVNVRPCRVTDNSCG